jgi:hypothetical protein
MKVHDKHQRNLDEVALLIDEARSEQGSPMFNPYEIAGINSVLESCIDFQPVIPATDRAVLITEAVSKVVAQGPVTSESLLRALSECEKRYLRTPLIEYVLASWIGIAYDRRLSPIRLGPTTITFSADLPKHFERPSNEGPPLPNYLAEPPRGFSSVRIRLQARSKNSALESGLEQLDYVRALWNFRINSQTHRRKTFGHPAPVNRILRGPSYTLHTPHGKSVDKSVWYDTANPGLVKPYEVRDDWAQTRSFERKVRSRLNEIRYGDQLRRLFIRYTRALDSAEREVAFNQLWSVLEHLVASVGDYKSIAKRIAFLYKASDTRHAQIMVEHLRDVRNGIIHDAQDRSGMETYIWELKMFVEAAFKFHLGARPGFSSLGTAGDFLDLPADPQILARQIRLYRKALQYRAH